MEVNDVGTVMQNDQDQPRDEPASSPQRADVSGSSAGSVCALPVRPPIVSFGHASLPCAVGHGIRHMSVILIDRDNRREFWSESGILLGFCSDPNTLADQREWDRIQQG